MNFQTVKTELKKLDISIKRIVETDEYRVNWTAGYESQAYYTDDLLDAYQTGKIMAR
jgi:hypothetical protein